MYKMKRGPNAKSAENILGKMCNFDNDEIEVCFADYLKLRDAGWTLISAGNAGAMRKAVDPIELFKCPRGMTVKEFYSIWERI